MNKLMHVLKGFITDPKKRFGYLSKLGYYNSMPDEEYLKISFRNAMGYELNLDDPKTFNEKIQWLKLYNRRPEYTVLVDKYKVRSYIAEKLGEQYLIPLLGVWEDPNDIDFDALPDQFVLKCNHNSGLGMCICKDKSSLDIKKVKRELSKGLKQNYYLTGREWPYKDVPRRIIAEQYISELEDNNSAEYKVFCFDGEPKIVLVCKGKAHSNERTNDWCDLEFKRLPFKSLNPTSNGVIKAPENKEELFSLCRKISSGIPHLRVDTYIIGDKIYLGELTFYHNSGMCAFEPDEWDQKLGAMIHLTGVRE